MLEVYFETYGCTANKNSSEIMKGLVKQSGLDITSKEDFADLIVINSCIVKTPTQEKIRRRVQNLLKQYPDKKIILAGCMPRFISKKMKNNENLFLLDTSHIKDILNLIQDIQEGTYAPEKYLKKRNEVKTSLPKSPDNSFIGINQISEGCLGECSYCIVRLAKGKLFSYPQEKIIQSIKNDLASGCREIWITSQDNASYGIEEGKYLLPELLREILELKGNFLVRLGMMNPNNVLKILPELIETYKHPKMFKFLHLPIQSGSDRILKMMKRKYTRKDILKIIREFKKEIPKIIFSTDIIVGFPGETEKDFQETLDLIKDIRPEILNRSNFYPLKQTPAEKLGQIYPKIINERASRLMNLHLNICNEIQKPFLNTEHNVLIDKKGFPGTYLARDKNYKLFAVKSRNKILGKYIKVKVKKILPHYLISEAVD
jgi:MiaB-like tRNA modifying enzyme